MMRKKIFSIFGLIAIVGFFLPWLKACDEVKTGFELLIFDSLKDFSVGSLLSLNTGLVFLIVPIFVFLVAWLKHPTKKPYIAFGVLSGLTLVNVGLWGGSMLNVLIEEWGTVNHQNALFMLKIFIWTAAGAVFLTAFLVKWLRTRHLNLGWGCAALVLQIMTVASFAFTIEPIFYGLWVYLFGLAGLIVGSAWSGIKDKDRL
jgi:hypothetical protein